MSLKITEGKDLEGDLDLEPGVLDDIDVNEVDVTKDREWSKLYNRVAGVVRRKYGDRALSVSIDLTVPVALEVFISPPEAQHVDEVEEEQRPAVAQDADAEPESQPEDQGNDAPASE